MNYQEKEFSQWAIYEGNTQAYRSNMVATQSLLMAVAAIFFDKNTILTLSVCIIGLIIQWAIWFRVISSRMIISDFHKFNALYEFSKKVNDEGMMIDPSDSNQKELTEQIYVKEKDVQKRANAALVQISGNPSLKTNWRLTRKKLDLVLPIVFSIIWIAMIGFKLANIFFA